MYEEMCEYLGIDEEDIIHYDFLPDPLQFSQFFLTVYYCRILSQSHNKSKG